MSRRERQLLEELIQAEVSRRLPELWTLARDLHRRDWGRPQALRRAMRDISSFLRSSGFTLRTIAPHIINGFAGVATGRAPGPHVMLVAPFGHGAVATAMAVGAASSLAALRMRWPGEVTVAVLPPRWQQTPLNYEALALAEQTAVVSATIGRVDALAAPTTYRTRARIVFSKAAADGTAGADALQVAVSAYQDALAHGISLPNSERLTAELHTRQASRRGVHLAELHLQLESLTEAGLAGLIAFVDELAQRWHGLAALGDVAPAAGTAAAADDGSAGTAGITDPPVTAPSVLWRKLGRLPAETGGWDVVPNDLTELGLHAPLGVSVLGVGKAPGDHGFAQAVWGGQGERALRDGATLLSWQVAHILMDGLSAHGRAEAAATTPVTDGTD